MKVVVQVNRGTRLQWYRLKLGKEKGLGLLPDLLGLYCYAHPCILPDLVHFASLSHLVAHLLGIPHPEIVFTTSDVIYFDA